MKSYVSDFLSDSSTSQDTRQFSRHLLANLTALLGLQDTYLYTDVVFQDSFLPRSIGLNLSSPLLKQVGGSVQVTKSHKETWNICVKVIVMILGDLIVSIVHASYRG